MLTESEKTQIFKLNVKNHFGFTNAMLLNLITRHKNARAKGDFKTMEKIEYRLTDCNFHYECGEIANNRYDMAKKYIKKGE